MLEVGRGHLDVHKLSAHSLELRLRLGHVHVRGDAALQPAFGQVELPLQVRRRCASSRSDLRVEPAQLEVVCGELGLERQVHVGQVGGGGLRVLARLPRRCGGSGPRNRAPSPPVPRG